MKSLRHVLNASTVVFLGLMMLFANISVAQSEQAYWPTAEWRTSSPEQQLLNKEILKKLKKRIRRNEIADIDSLIIVRN